ncbi:MAG: hypothetical protein LBJ41_10265, partial [Treponema sp.]|nr:hypothetical protein [Treponema sp.]
YTLPRKFYTLPRKFYTLPKNFYTLPRKFYTLPKNFYTLPKNFYTELNCGAVIAENTVARSLLSNLKPIHNMAYMPYG